MLSGNKWKAIEFYANLMNNRYFIPFAADKFLERLEKMPQKESEEVDWIQLVTDADAQFQLGQMYEEGRGVKKDEKKAAQLYEKAANQGNSRSSVSIRTNV